MGLEFANGVNVARYGTDVDDRAQGHEGDTGVYGGAGGVKGGMDSGQCLLLLQLAKEESETRDSEAYAHEREAGADPGE